LQSFVLIDLKKKWLRTELLDSLQGTLDKKTVRRKCGKHVDDPIKNTRLEEVGDQLSFHHPTPPPR
jgi:hypothetical protein